MKKTINSSCRRSLVMGALLALLTNAACGGADSREESAADRSNAQILQEMQTIKAIGKVAPRADWVILSSPVSARVLEIRAQEGDTVAAEQELLLLESGTSELSIQQARASANRIEAEIQVTEAELEKARVLAAEHRKHFETSRRLRDQRAETPEQTRVDSSAWQQQELVVRGLNRQLAAQRASLKEQHLEIEKARQESADFRITAPRAGILVEWTAKTGQYVTGSDELGRMADPANPIVEAEVDELLADRVQVGQRVILLAVNRPDTLARGRVSYVSPVLSDKSILYEMANEGQDRRVRRIRIEPDSTAQQRLTINSKVDCEIALH